MKVNNWLIAYFDKFSPLRGAVFLSIVSIYFTNRSPEWSSFNAIGDVFLTVLMLVLLFWSFSVNRILKNFFIIYVIIIGASAISFLFSGIFNIHWLYLVICLEIIRLNIVFTGRSLHLVCVLGFLAILIQVSIFRFDDGRPVLSIGDPNYSAYYVFIFLLFAHASRKPLMESVLIAIMLLSLSRTAFIALILFGAYVFLRNYYNCYPKINKWIYFCMVLLGPIFYSLIFVWSGIDIDIAYTSDVNRLTSFADQSNMDRSLANINFFEYIYNNPISIVSGVDIDYYTNNIFRNAPHASVYALIFNYGIFYMLSVFLAVIMIIRSVDNKFSISMLGASLLPWMIFLGGVLFGPQIIFLGLILNSLKIRYD